MKQIYWCHFVGEYERPYTFGVQVESTIPTVQRASFRTRRGWEKVFISPGHLRELVGRDSPGAGTYSTSNSRATSAGSRFGRAERPEKQRFFPLPPETTPGYEYEQSSKLCFPSSQKSSFPRTLRALHRSEKHANIGPGLYESSHSPLHAHGGGFGLSYNSFRNMTFPGLNRERLGRGSWSVGGFNPRFASASVSVSFARDRRHNWFDQVAVANAVGPGAYECKNNEDVRSPRFAKPTIPRPRLEFKKWGTMHV